MPSESPPSPDFGLTVLFTGLPCSGKTTLARRLEQRLFDAGRRVEVLDGDVVRTHLSADLGFSREDRDKNVLRVGFVAHLLARNGVIVLCSLVSPYREARQTLREMHEGRFLEAYVAAPVEVCAERDVKGLYARQRAGELTGLTGMGDPYEQPLAADLVVNSHLQTVEESVEAVWQTLERRWA